MNTILQKVQWEKVNGLLPAIIQDDQTNMVAMLGYMNAESLAKTIDTGTVWFYSRTRQRLWMKGETSGNTLRVVDMQLDCDCDTLLIRVAAQGPTCHTGAISCFGEQSTPATITTLFGTILGRKQQPKEGSYTSALFAAGMDKMALKVAEESLEVVHAAQKETPERLVEETVDLLYHLFVLLVEKNIRLEQVEAEMKKRRKA